MANNNKTDVNHVKQQNQKAEANKQYASGATNSAMDVEFGTETDVNHVKQQNQKAEANKKFASGNTNANNSK